MKPYIITIARQYGSGGKTVGKMLANKLDIPYYNREIITMASEDSGINAMLFSDERLKPDFLTRLRSRYKGDTSVINDSSRAYLRDDALFDYQAKIIRKLADQGPCVLIGRCADYILKGRPDVVRVFVHADAHYENSSSSRMADSSMLCGMPWMLPDGFGRQLLFDRQGHVTNCTCRWVRSVSLTLPSAGRMPVSKSFDKSCKYCALD